jgi:predicted small secreted protein
MRRIIIVLALGVMICTLTACETMKGLGKDVEGAGEWVQEKAK